MIYYIGQGKLLIDILRIVPRIGALVEHALTLRPPQ
jgi:hypothetical protein